MFPDAGSPGVLLANLGSPRAPTVAALRPYLRQFLGDRRVIEAPRALWWLVLNLVIVPFRSGRSARLYQHIWTEEGSPLVATTARLAEAVEETLRRGGLEAVSVAPGMRYGQPSIATALRRLRAAGCDRILILPLFPQYSATTVGSTFDAVARELGSWRAVPALRTISSYHDDPEVIAAQAADIAAQWDRHGEPERLLISFHGLPAKYAAAGDPYPAQCERSARLLAEALGLPDDRWAMAYQSRFGRGRWLEPSTASVLTAWGRERLTAVHVACPGFPAYCLETLHEIAVEGRRLYAAAGGRGFRYLTALNASPPHVEALAALAHRHLAGW